MCLTQVEVDFRFVQIRLESTGLNNSCCVTLFSTSPDKAALLSMKPRVMI